MIAAIATTMWPDSTVRMARLSLGGLDVLNTYPGWTTGFAVKRDSIVIQEVGAGGVSTMSVTISDPRLELTLEEGQDVEFWDIARDRPLFRGFIQSFGVRPTAVGREVVVDCIGIECLLDWMKVPPITIPVGTDQVAAIQSLVANATGVGWPIRALAYWSVGIGYSPYSSVEMPIAVAGTSSLDYDLVITGGTLREAIAKVFTSSVTSSGGSPKLSMATNGALVTIDYYGGLRVIPTYLTNGVTTVYLPSDYDDLAISNTPAGTLAASDLDMIVDGAGVVRAVYISGANAAGSGLVSDGSGIPGPVAEITDDTSDTAQKMQNIGADYLYGFSQSIRGSTSLLLDSTTLTPNIRPGGTITFTSDSQTFGHEVSFVIASIRKTFLAGDLQAWTLNFGGLPPSAIRQMRRATRQTLS